MTQYSDGARHSDGAWYEKSFGLDYLKLYAHRDAAEARADIDFMQSCGRIAEEAAECLENQRFWSVLMWFRDSELPF